MLVDFLLPILLPFFAQELLADYKISAKPVEANVLTLFQVWHNS
jgi:hypothetical protein